jgi:hypothetical protein
MRARLAILLVAVATAHAASAAGNLQKSGLAGTWAPKCEAAASSENAFVTFAAAANGKIVRTVRTQGSAGGKVRELDSLTVLADKKVTYTITDAVEQTTVTLLKEPERFKVWSSVTGAGLFYGDQAPTVTEGKLTQTGKDTPWLTKCANP